MKKTLIGAMLLLGSMSFAQKSITTGELALKETEQMKTELQLTPVQIENVASINNGIANSNHMEKSINCRCANSSRSRNANYCFV